VELYLHSPNTPSWRGDQSNTGTNLSLHFTLLKRTKQSVDTNNSSDKAISNNKPEILVINKIDK
jgi:hypothetical protein